MFTFMYLFRLTLIMSKVFFISLTLTHLVVETLHPDNISLGIEKRVHRRPTKYETCLNGKFCHFGSCHQALGAVTLWWMCASSLSLGLGADTRSCSPWSPDKVSWILEGGHSVRQSPVATGMCLYWLAKVWQDRLWFLSLNIPVCWS